ncbi:alpha/beta hydrolase [Sphingomonas koreensis]|nr:alpha/beta hydrolase [Sphingomonas koreensis]
MDNLASFRDALAGVAPEATDAVSAEQVEAIGADGHVVPCILHRARSDAPLPVILNIHGGGYVVGDAAREAPAMSALAATLGCAVLSVDYRLAPDAPYPAALDDCAAALQWLQAQASALNIDPGRIVIRGVSAGGGLAAGLMLRCAESMELPPRLLMLIYPMLDNRLQPAGRTGNYVWTRDANRFGWDAYLGEHAANPPLEAVPGMAENLAAFPPTFIAVGDIDLFLAENLEFAARLARSQVGVELHVYRGGYHGFNLIPNTPLSNAFARDCLEALRRAFGLAPAEPSTA